MKLAACCLFLFPAILSSQRPPQPGRLFVTSTPSGAAILIDGQRTGKMTDFTFLVSPGNHSLTLSQPGLQKCAVKTNVLVRSGYTASIGCTSAGWSQATYK